MFKEFKEFAFKGNVLDLAIGVIIGAAFGKIVTALVDNILMPLIAAFFAKPNVAELQFMVGKTPIVYGVFVQSVIDFLLVAIVLFGVVKAINITRRKQEAEAPAAPPPSEEVLLLREIRDSLQK
ncbi:large conductance mechanosensitive channel protein MscL [Herpetosiphon sp. NSE202]|uniref:large conductance mechanosensitive channel protein MscL n=1 Tax=Herpetosiphon sp. NSE202 TaxID=3351349 RepID=UPI0036354671